jgi:hypothetical protein
MFKYLLAILILLLLSPVWSYSQIRHDGPRSDSLCILFNGPSISNFLCDTAPNPLWQMGHSYKPFFGTDSIGALKIMTDTIQLYPVNANNWFTIMVRHGPYTLIDFWHKYQTSTDHGMNWQNIKGACNYDSSGSFEKGVYTSNFYSFNDTLVSGEPSFNGQSDSTLFSRFQFIDGYAKNTSGAPCNWPDSFFVRFRFLSDSVPDTLAGWIIDSIKVTYFYQDGFASNMQRHSSLPVAPNPSGTGSFLFPAIKDEQDYTLEIYNSTGIRIITTTYTTTITLDKYAPGLYLYRVTNGIDCYSGQLLYDQ